MARGIDINQKPVSVRLPEEAADELGTLARVEGVSLSEIVRAAIYQFIAARRADSEFQKRVREQVEKDREVLDRLAGSAG